MNSKAIFSEDICASYESLSLSPDMQMYLEHDATALIHKYMRLNGYSYGLSYMAVLQECLIAAAKAMLRYDASKYNTKLETYIWIAIENCIKQETRRQRSQRAMQEQRDIPFETGTFVYGPEYMDDIIERRSRRAWLDRAVSDPETGLDEDERQIIQLTRKGFVQSEIGKAIGCSQSVVSTKKTSAVQKLCAHLQDNMEKGTVDF